jgi:hypothetical protein
MVVATFPPQTWTSRGATQALTGWLGSMRYVAAPFGRDPRLDLLRGFCVFAMIVDHVGGTSWLYALTGGNRGPTTAAEGFVFLSGLVLGMVSRKRVSHLGLRGAALATLKRAWTLYGLTVTLTAIFLALTVATNLALWVDRGQLGEVANWPALLGSVALVRFTWHGTDILALYALLLAVSPLALALLAKGHQWKLLSASSSLWLAYQVAPEHVVIPWTIQHAATFPFAAWQLLFMVALSLGYYRREVGVCLSREAARPRTGRTFRVGLGAAALVLLLLGGALSTEQAYAMGQQMHAISVVDLFDKTSLGVGRLAVFASMALVAYAALTAFWRPIQRALGWLLIPLGQASLYAYAVHLFLILVAYNVPPYVGSDQPGMELHNTVGQLALVLAIWAMVKRKVLFSLIPR